MSRKLATVRKISDIQPIEGADAIEVATVDGWKVVIKKNEYKIGDPVIYCEIDSWIPHTVAPFLTRPGHPPKEYNGVQGERLRTVKLRGQISQGLILPCAKDIFQFHEAEGLDVSDMLNIQKWEAPIAACLSGKVRGNFPSFIPKTDQERVQNLKKEFDGIYKDYIWEVTEKLDGSSMTVYMKDGEFGVCSRNLDLIEDENNSDRSRVFVHMDNGDVYELKMEKLSKEQLNHCNNFYSN